MHYVNLTPHAINIYGDNGELKLTVLPSGEVARCATNNTVVGTDKGFPLVRTTFGEVQGLPAPKADTTYVVSALVRSALPERTDLASPGALIRDDQGRPVGCEGLIVN